MSSEFERLRSLTEPLILYVGPELSISAGLPGRAELAATLLREAEDYVSPKGKRELEGLVEAGELTDAFTELERALTPATFGRIVERELDDGRHRELPPLARAIAALAPRVRGVITPNLDHLVERAFEGSLAVHAQPVADLVSRRDWLLKIHGTLRDRSTWVFTEEQRGRVLYRNPLHGQVFRSLFLAHPILFVGTRLDDPVLVDVVEQITALAQGQPPNHWALVDEAEALPGRRRKCAGAGINLIGYSSEDDCLRMLGELAGQAPASKPPEPKPPVARPKPKSEPRAAEQESAQLSVLFLAANPSGTDPLRLDRELRIIREAIQLGRDRDKFHFEICTAATIHDLRRALLKGRYDVVHISGHGEREGLILEDERGESVQVPKKALAALLRKQATESGLRCVLMNACWSLEFGDPTTTGVPFTIAMDGPISDIGALEFSRGFYDALAAGKDFAAAYAEGRLCVELAAPDAKFDVQLFEA
jgi:hypothetical protein